MGEKQKGKNKMGDRVSISFKDKDNDESIILFHHWGGTKFPKVAFDWFKDYKKKIDKTAKSNVSTPITRFDSNNVMVQFVQWLGQGGHYRQCTGFEKDENDESIYDEPLYSDYLISDSLYFGKDTNEGDNSDNGHYTIYTKKCELIDDRGQSIK